MNRSEAIERLRVAEYLLGRVAHKLAPICDDKEWIGRQGARGQYSLTFSDETNIAHAVDVATEVRQDIRQAIERIGT